MAAVAVAPTAAVVPTVVAAAPLERKFGVPQGIARLKEEGSAMRWK